MCVCVFVCVSRIFVQSGIHDAFVERLSAAVTELRLGDPFQDDTDQGPLINEQAVLKVLYCRAAGLLSVVVHPG